MLINVSISIVIVKKEMRYWISHDITYLTVRKYNKKKKVAAIYDYEAKGFVDCGDNDLTKYRLFDFDEYGQYSKWTGYSSNGELMGNGAYAYEADGHSYLEIINDASGNKTSSAKYTYKPLS